MSLILDIGCLILIWVIAARGYKKGLVKGFFGVLSFALSGIVTAIIYKPASEYILSIDLVSEKVVAVGEKISGILSQSQQDAASDLPMWFSEAALSAAETANVAIANSVTSILVSVFCIVVVYLLVKLAFRLLEGVLDIIMRFPILSLVNRAGGMVCGIITSVVVLWIVLACVVLFAGTDFFESVNQSIQATSLVKYFYNNNLLIKLIIK